MTRKTAHSNPNDDTTRDESIETDRRTTLQLAGAAVVGAGGLAATSGSAAGQWFAGGVEEFDLDGADAADELPESEASELVIYLHGGGVGSSADEQGQDLEDGLADAGYETTVIAGVYSTSAVGIGDETSEPADNLADLIEDYYETTDGTVRLVGYSLGGILTMQTLNALDEEYTVETAVSFGTGTPGSTVCEDDEVYYDGIVTRADEFRVLVSEDDDAVQMMDGMEPDCGGFFGSGTPPENLTTVDVTHDVDGHLVYLESDAVMDDLVDSFADGDDDDDDDDDGWGWW